jgi:hypothetical protein
MDKNPKYKMRNYKTPGREGKIFINNTSNKWFVSKIHKEKT